MTPMTKRSVHYQAEATDMDHCADCRHFVPARTGQSASCRIVEGTINPGGWCDQFDPMNEKVER